MKTNKLNRKSEESQENVALNEEGFSQLLEKLAAEGPIFSDDKDDNYNR